MDIFVDTINNASKPFRPYNATYKTLDCFEVPSWFADNDDCDDSIVVVPVDFSFISFLVHIKKSKSSKHPTRTAITRLRLCSVIQHNKIVWVRGAKKILSSQVNLWVAKCEQLCVFARYVSTSTSPSLDYFTSYQA